MSDPTEHEAKPLDPSPPEEDAALSHIHSFWYLVNSDVRRLGGGEGWRAIARQLIVGETFAYVFWMRACSRLVHHSGPTRALLLPARLVLRHLRYKMGINIPWRTNVGPGLLVGHAGGIVVNAEARLGVNCNLSHNVTIGANKGRRAGVPKIGDRVYIGPGAVIIGAITIGNDAAIGANAVVLDDVPEGVTVAGIPARVVSGTGSGPWIHHTQEVP